MTEKSDGNTFYSDQSFEDLGLEDWLCENCASMGIKRPTHVQAKCIPAILSGKDVLSRAKTGSGKTAAFSLPILQELAQDPFGVFALVLTASRELAFQIEEQISAVSGSFTLKTCVIVGGVEITRNATELESRPHIVIATPGRLRHLLDDGAKFHAKHLRFLVLDEADRLFETKVWNDVGRIIEYLPSKNRQTLLFSATLDSSMEELANLKLSKNAVFIDVSRSSFDGVKTIQQNYLFIPQLLKLSYLVALIKADCWENKCIVIFIATCEYCRYIGETFNVLEIPCAVLHSEINQRRRLAALGKFKNGVVQILITTDVGSRGLDIPDVELVVNYDVPRVAEDYIHRVGRTGRVNRKGQAISFVTQHTISLYKKVEEMLEKKLEAYEFPGGENAAISIQKKVELAHRKARSNLEYYDLQNPDPNRKRKQEAREAKIRDRQSKRQKKNPD